MENKNKEKRTKMAEKDIVGTRGRTFQGTVVKKFPRRVVIEFDRTIYVPKFERFSRKTTRLHARLPDGMNIKEGDYIKVRECRPLSKIIHFVVVKKIRDGESKVKTKRVGEKK